jgi:hypothetical protein
MQGTSLTAYARNVVSEVVSVGRSGTGGTERNANFAGADFLPDTVNAFLNYFHVAGGCWMHLHATAPSIASAAVPNNPL